MELTPLDKWNARKAGIPYEKLTRETMAEYQLRAVRRVLGYVKSNSAFYRERLKNIDPEKITGFKEFQKVPFTYPQDIREDPLRFLCVGQNEIERVVTLFTSGTTGESKRFFFTSHDLQLTIDYFEYGMSTFTRPGDRVLILMPGERPGSVGDLLKKALGNMNAVGIVHGPVRDPEKAIEQAVAENVNILVGIPVQVLGMVRHSKGHLLKNKIENVLLSTDHLPDAIKRAIEEAWGCKVFSHYGMTEMGLGGGVYCKALSGYHLQEADFLFEIIDPETGQNLEDGKEGEVVITTLTRNGMPLIRYRTGDISRFLTDNCICGSRLRRLAPLKNRADGDKVINNCRFNIGQLDEALFVIPWVLDFRAAISGKDPEKKLSLKIRAKSEVLTESGSESGSISPYARIMSTLKTIPGLSELNRENIFIDITDEKSPWQVSTGTAKRRISETEYCAVILAGGYSSRMGDFKPLLSLGDAAVVERTAEIFRLAGIKDIYVVTGYKSDEFSAFLRLKNINCIYNKDFDRGMFSSVKAGIEAIMAGNGWPGDSVSDRPGTENKSEPRKACFIHPVDCCLVRPYTIMKLMDFFDHNNAKVVFPVCRGEKGHPPLLDMECGKRIPEWEGEGGLRELLREFQDETAVVEISDEGILRDMDTREDYLKASEDFKRGVVPDREECLYILRKFSVPEEVILHSLAVEKVATDIYKKIMDKTGGKSASECGNHRAGGNSGGAEINLDGELITAATLLHDIARVSGRDHARAGAELAGKLGYPRLSPLIARHMDFMEDGFTAEGPIFIDEAAIVYLADKMVMGSEVIDISERLRIYTERYSDSKEAEEKIKTRLNTALMIKEKIDKIIKS